MLFNKNKFQKIVSELICLFIIAFFCYTATNKFMNLESFRTNLIKTSLFDIKTASYFSLIVIFWEVFIVLFLLFSKKIGLTLFTITMLIFTLYISFLRFKGLYEVCGCGGILNGLKYEYHLIINIILMFSGLYLLTTSNFELNEK